MPRINKLPKKNKQKLGIEAIDYWTTRKRNLIPESLKNDFIISF